MKNDFQLDGVKVLFSNTGIIEGYEPSDYDNATITIYSVRVLRLLCQNMEYTYPLERKLESINRLNVVKLGF